MPDPGRWTLELRLPVTPAGASATEAAGDAGTYAATLTYDVE